MNHYDSTRFETLVSDLQERIDQEVDTAEFNNFDGYKAARKAGDTQAALFDLKQFILCRTELSPVLVDRLVGALVTYLTMSKAMVMCDVDTGADVGAYTDYLKDFVGKNWVTK